MEGTKKIKSTSFHQYSWNSEVETTWISLIGWHHKTCAMYHVPWSVNNVAIAGDLTIPYWCTADLFFLPKTRRKSAVAGLLLLHHLRTLGYKDKNTFSKHLWYKGKGFIYFFLKIQVRQYQKDLRGLQLLNLARNLFFSLEAFHWKIMIMGWKYYGKLQYTNYNVHWEHAAGLNWNKSYTLEDLTL